MIASDTSIAGRKIGPDHEPYVICELSGNHNGSLDRALELLDAAAATGADAIKIQTYTPDTITIDHDGPGFRIEGGLWDGRTLYELYGEAQTPFEWHAALFAPGARARRHALLDPVRRDRGRPARGARRAGLQDRLVRSDRPAADRLRRRKRQADDHLDRHGQSRRDRRGGPDRARERLRRASCCCTASAPIPRPDEQSNVRTVPDLAERVRRRRRACPTTRSASAVAVASVALGGCVVEKHFTLARADGGPDAAFSLEPDEFRRWSTTASAPGGRSGARPTTCRAASAARWCSAARIYVVRDVPRAAS